MKPNRKTAIIVGVLFIFATTFFIIGEAIYNPIISSPDYLKNTHPNRLIVLIGILVEMIAVFSIILIPAFLFSMLKQYNEALAVGYAGFRFLEAGFLLITMVGVLSQVNISQDYLGFGISDSSHYDILWNGVQAVKDWAFMMAVSFLFPVGALMFYFLAYKMKFIPDFLSVWGFLAAALLLLGSVLVFLDLLAGVSLLAQELIFSLPIAVQEIVMAIWLIAKGFNPKTKLIHDFT